MTAPLIVYAVASFGLAAISRPSFLGLLASTPFSLSVPHSQNDISIPLKWLPVAGCLAVPIIVDEQFRYPAVIDSGSPFLTAPSDVMAALSSSSSSSLLRDVQQSKSKRLSFLMLDPTNEQYGETAAPVTWRRVDQILVAGVFGIQPCTLGIVPDVLRQDTGGLFCGLMWEDDNRPSFLKQAKISSFTIDYTTRILTLHETTPQLQKGDPNVMDMFDLTPYGPDLHHYAVLANSLAIFTVQGHELAVQDCTRPIVVVIDTGLTGCIFSDSMRQCLPVETSRICGARVNIGGSSSSSLSTTTLTSDKTYWNLACFRLPWFRDEQNHPHIVALGATFLKGSRITVDAKQRRLKLSNLEAIS